MTNKEILNADILDILFENRNKMYGAYALRKNYHHRLSWSLSAGLAFPLLLLLINVFGKKNSADLAGKPPDLNFATVELPGDKPKEPVQPKQQKQPEVAQVRDAGIKIVPDDIVKKPEIPTISELQNAQISTVTKPGFSPDSMKGNPGITNGNVIDNEKKGWGATEFHGSQTDAQYPGGKAAFAAFLAKYLVTPDDLEAGEKKTVLVRFKVDTDGGISQTEIIQSGGEKYDREVIRVLHKMPRWVPAQQNDIRVVTYFIQPVSFIGLEQ